MQSHTIDANTQEREASRIARHGKRYYKVDESYDKRVYENTSSNIARIVVTLIIFWIFQSFHWWGVLSLGIVATDALIWYSIACFVFTIFFLAAILVSGKYANALKREHEFYIEKIAEKRAEMSEKSTKEAQEAAHQAKLSAQAEKIAKEKRAADLQEQHADQALDNTGAMERQTQGYAINDERAARDGRLIQENRM